MPASSDRELLRRYVEGADEPAFRRLLERHLGLVIVTAMRRLSSREDSEDVALEVFTILSRKASQLRDHPTIVGWIQKTTHFQVAKALRRKQTRSDIMNAYQNHLQAETKEEGTPSSAWVEAAESLPEALQGLPEKDRQLIQHRYIEGLPYRDIGEALGITERASRVRAKRAIDRLSKWFTRRGYRLTTSSVEKAIQQHRIHPSTTPMKSDMEPSSSSSSTGSHSQPTFTGGHAETIRRMIQEAPPFRPEASPEELVAEFANGPNRMAAFLALYDRGAEVLPAVREGFRHPNWQIRRWCAAFADNAADRETLLALLPLLDDPKAQVRLWAVHAVACAHCKHEEAHHPDIDPVALLLDKIDNDPNLRVRRQAVAMLAHHVEPDPRVLPVFHRIMDQEDDRKLRLHASEGIDRYARPS